MKLLAKVRLLDRADRALLVRAAALHTAIVVLVRVAPFGWVLRLLEVFCSSRTLHHGSVVESDAAAAISHEHRVVWAVRGFTARAPAGSSCLTRALTTYVLLKRGGFESTIQFGVAPAATPGAPLAAHAWVECGARVLIGGETRHQFDVLSDCSTVNAHLPTRNSHWQD